MKQKESDFEQVVVSPEGRVDSPSYNDEMFMGENRFGVKFGDDFAKSVESQRSEVEENE